MHPAVAPARSFWTVDDVDVDELADLIDHPVSPASYPNAALVDDGVVVYDMPDPNGGADRAALLTEIATALDSGPGIVVLRRAVERTVLSRATDAFEAIIEVERRSDSGAGDHFAAPGANDRVWNALEKLAVADPGVFVDYYATEAIELAATAWLGPHYQVTSQINVVNPSGGAQSPHRDYHLGFMTDDQAARFPARAHLMSAGLTLQGAVAHVDMPVASGPTMFLPHSQKYPLGYLAYRRPEVVELFQRRHRQFPLAAGDAVFFNPAVIHAAGCNRTADVRRMANLLQISSPFGRAMESVDRDQVVRAVYPELRRRRSALAASALDRAVAAAAEGYPFPTNLDLDPPLGGLAPPSQADVVRRALAEDWSPSTLDEALATHGRKRRTS